jgi:hypothetical protein
MFDSIKILKREHLDSVVQLSPESLFELPEGAGELESKIDEWFDEREHVVFRAMVSQDRLHSLVEQDIRSSP